MNKRSEPSSKPTNAELVILRVLWKRGPSTVREVYDALLDSRAMGYTSVLKLLQIMNEKGLVTRSDDGRVHVYQSSFSEEQTEKGLVRDLMDRVFAGSAERLVLHALTARQTSPEALAAIRQLLDELEGGPSDATA